MAKPVFNKHSKKHVSVSNSSGGSGGSGVSGKSIVLYNQSNMMLGGQGSGKSYAIYNSIFAMLEDIIVFPKVKCLEEKMIMELVGNSQIHIFSNDLTLSELEKIADMFGKSGLKQYFADYVTINNSFSLEILKSMRISHGSAIFLYEISIGKDYESIKAMLNYLKNLGCAVVTQSQPKSN